MTFGAPFLGATWSLAVEEQFYLVIPLFIYVLAGQKKVFGGLIIGFILFAPLLRHITPDLGFYVFAWCRMDCIFMGVGLAYLSRQKKFKAMITTHLAWVWATLFLLFVTLACLINIGWTGIGQVTNHFILALFYTAFVILALYSKFKPLKFILENPILRWIGWRSYAIYLFHVPIMGLVFGLAFGRVPELKSPIDVIAIISTIVLVCIASEISYHTLEKPMLRIGYKYKFIHRNKESLGT